MNALTDVETAWLAGIYEGEGSCGIRGSSIRVEIVMTDEDVMTRIHELTGIGSLRPVARRNSEYKQAFRWACGSQAAYDFLALILPWLGQRRTERVNEAFDAFWNNRKQRRSFDMHCIHGHELTEENVYMNGTVRACRSCRRAASKRHRAKRAAARLATVAGHS